MDGTNQIQVIIKLLQTVFAKTKKQQAVIGVSGGIDSAVSLTLLTKALGVHRILPIFLPYKSQSVEDSHAICDWNGYPQERRQIIHIEQSVDQICETCSVPITEKVRRGNIMARVRMIILFDLAKQYEALVCGTENKSESYLGYFTRFGDEASDIEPLQHLTKTQVRGLATALSIPEQFLKKLPSAGLWPNQSDEQEFGFSYEEADMVIESLEKNLPIPVSEAKKQHIVEYIQSRTFKHQVPYTLRNFIEHD